MWELAGGMWTHFPSSRVLEHKLEGGSLIQIKGDAVSLP